MEEEEAMLFWDEFAQEYAQIQRESQLKIAEEVAAFWWSRKCSRYRPSLTLLRGLAATFQHFILM